MAGDDKADHTVPLTREMKQQLAAEAKRILEAPETPNAHPPGDVQPPENAENDSDKTTPISAQERSALASQAQKILADDEPKRPKTKVTFTSNQIEPVGNDLLPFESAHDAGFEDVARTEALPASESDESSGPRPLPSRARAAPVVDDPIVAPVAAPPPSPTQFDIDVATSMKGNPLASETATTGREVADAALAPSPGAELAAPPTTVGGGEGDDEVERSMAKTGFVDMEAELSDGTGLLKVMAIGLLVLGAVIALLLILR